jgi:hypothetical protein
VTRVGETTCRMGRRSDDAGDRTFDLITSQGKICSELADTLKSNYKVVRVLEDNELDADDLWMQVRQVVRD